jgi:hypothetical protein
MDSLWFEQSSRTPARAATRALNVCARTLGTLARTVLALGAVACGGDDEGDAATVALADSGSLTDLQDGKLGIPTTVQVRDGIAWVVESQFDRYEPFQGPGVGEPGDFRLVGLPLAGGDPLEIDLPDEFFPEGIAVTPGGQLFVGSVADGSIYMVDPGSDQAQGFVNGELLDYSAIGMASSPDGRTLWVCDTNTAGTPPYAAVVGIDIATSTPVASHELNGSEAGVFCNDITVAPSGALWISESFGGRIFRVAPEDLRERDSAEEWLEADQLKGTDMSPFGVNGITLAGGRMFVVNSTTGELLGIDPTLSSPSDSDLERIELTEITSDTGDVVSEDVTLVGPDGVTGISPGELLIVENGLGAPPEQGRRVVYVRLGAL